LENQTILLTFLRKGYKALRSRLGESPVKELGEVCKLSGILTKDEAD